MTETHVAVDRPLRTPASTGGSFERDLLVLLRQRARLVFTIGLGISGFVFLLKVFILGVTPEVDSFLAPYYRFGWLAHPAIFFGAIVLLQTWRGASVRQYQALVLAVSLLQVFLALTSTAFYTPNDPLLIAVALTLFIPAALIPWPMRYQVMLGVAAVAAFLIGKWLSFQFVPALDAYWAARGGRMVLVNHMVEGTFGTLVLAIVSIIVCRTLYTLRKTAYKAKRLGNYLVLEELGQGGMGTVYLAQHSLLCRPTAVKVMKRENQNPTALARFEREVRLSATLTHPNTITIYDFGRTEAADFYYAMEYLEGLDLQELVERFGPVPASRTAYILAQVAGSLAEAHSRDIVHRDIKPSNIFLTRRGGMYDFVKVLDFGLAKRIETDPDSVALTQSGVVFGTPLYIAPETVYGPDQVDGRADIYNLGGVAYWMLTGRPPFNSGRSVEVLIDHVKTIPKRPSEISELEIPPELEAIIMRCLEKKPEDRFDSAEELEQELQALSFGPVWDRAKAREWWSLHGIIGDNPRDCECFVPDEELSAAIELPQFGLEQASFSSTS